MILVIDTETSGKADFKERYSAPCQPRMLSFCGLLYSEFGSLVTQFSTLVRHSSKIEIAPDAAAKNGLTSEMLSDYGIPIGIVLLAIDAMLQKATVVVGYNSQFDFLMLNREFYLARRLPPMDNGDFDEFCCMKAMTPICQIPSPYSQGGYKWPKLEEAYQHLFGTMFDGAHDATADAVACAKIYFELKRRNAPPPVFPTEPIKAPNKGSK